MAFYLIPEASNPLPGQAVGGKVIITVNIQVPGTRIQNLNVVNQSRWHS